MTIGERAAQAIHERSADTGVSPAKIMESMGGNRKTWVTGRNETGTHKHTGCSRWLWLVMTPTGF